MIAIVVAFLRPYLVSILLGVVIVCAGTGLYFKIAHDAKVATLAKVEQEKSDAIKKAREARDVVRNICITNPTCGVPDDWFRD